MNKNRNTLGKFVTDNNETWQDRNIDFWNEYVPFYKKHSRVETCKKFNITEAQHKSMCKFYKYKKSWADIHDVDITFDTIAFTFEEFKAYYETHSREQTCQYFNISIPLLKKYCKKYNYTKNKSLVGQQIKLTYKQNYGDTLWEKALKINFWQDYVPYYEAHSREDTIKYFNIDISTHNKLINYYNYTKQLELVQKIIIRRYLYNNIHFDSIPEVAVYIYCIDNNISIIKNTKSFNYMFNNKLHTYFPDFEINGQLIEIKGNQFFKKDGTMCNPFDHSQDALYEAKHQCGLANNVKFWTKKDYKLALDYCKQTYGKDWIKTKQIVKIKPINK